MPTPSVQTILETPDVHPLRISADTIALLEACFELATQRETNACWTVTDDNGARECFYAGVHHVVVKS